MSTGVFTCIECSQRICTQHGNKHEQIFVQQLNKLILDYEQLKQSTESRCDQSPTIIDEWERESIIKIHQMADDIRQELITRMEKHTNQLSSRLSELHEELNNAQKKNDFMETDLKTWSNRLDKLKSYLESPPSICLQDEKFISKLSIYTIPDDIFENFAGDLQIESNGQIVVHGPSVAHAVVRGSGEYSTGKHRFRFKIESYNINKWIFFGIISHKVTLRSNTWAIPSCYGWGGQDSTILNCAMHAGLNGYFCDFELNDTIEILLDCDNRTISLTNQRTKCSYRMDIDLIKCPFPWHFILNLFYPNDRVRILYVDTV
jgi:hypothetical protein